jgi:hypothetical protein
MAEPEMMKSETAQTDPLDELEIEVDFMDIDETDFGSFSRAEQIRHFEIEGYVMLPGVLDADLIQRLKDETADLPVKAKDYSDRIVASSDLVQWHSRAATELIGHPTVIDFLTDLMGPDIIFTRGFYSRAEYGAPSISMHTDGQPFGNSIFDYEGSCPRLLRVLYYLDDLTPQRAPLRVIPRSHLSFHADGNPYNRYLSHPGEKTLCVKAGSAVLFPVGLFHATHPNLDEEPRTLIQYGYRPAWAGPIQEVHEWDPELVANAPDIAKPFLRSPNTTGKAWKQTNKPPGMKHGAPGINPGRWG